MWDYSEGRYDQIEVMAMDVCCPEHEIERICEKLEEGYNGKGR